MEPSLEYTIGGTGIDNLDLNNVKWEGLQPTKHKTSKVCRGALSAHFL